MYAEERASYTETEFIFNLVKNSEFFKLPRLCCAALDVSPPAQLFEMPQ